MLVAFRKREHYFIAIGLDDIFFPRKRPISAAFHKNTGVALLFYFLTLYMVFTKKANGFDTRTEISSI